MMLVQIAQKNKVERQEKCQTYEKVTFGMVFKAISSQLFTLMMMNALFEQKTIRHLQVN